MDRNFLLVYKLRFLTGVPLAARPGFISIKDPTIILKKCLSLVFPSVVSLSSKAVHSHVIWKTSGIYTLIRIDSESIKTSGGRLRHSHLLRLWRSSKLSEYRSHHRHRVMHYCAFPNFIRRLGGTLLSSRLRRLVHSWWVNGCQICSTRKNLYPFTVNERNITVAWLSVLPETSLTVMMFDYRFLYSYLYSCSRSYLTNSTKCIGHKYAARQ